MSVTILDGDLFSDPAQVWVNAVNCQGVMGAGIAKKFRQRFPLYFLDYQTKCGDGLLELGRIDFYAVSPVSIAAPPPLFLVSFPTMLNPGEATRQQDLHQGLRSLEDFLDTFNMTEVAMPALGCGIGDYPFDSLVSLVKMIFDKYDDLIHINLYKPFDVRKHLDTVRV